MEIVGTCNLCRGPVELPSAWLSTLPATPTCKRCGATPVSPYGPLLEMVPRADVAAVRKRRQSGD